MGFLRGKKGAPEPEASQEAGASEQEPEQGHASSGRSLLSYFLPVGLAAVLVMLVIALFVVQEMGAVEDAATRTAVRSAADSLANRASGVVASHRGLLGLVGNFALVRKALEAGDPQGLEQAAAAAHKLLPEAIQLRLFPRGQVRPDPNGKAPLGFAGVDMVRRVLQGKEAGAEIHQIDGGHPYLAIARPVMQEGGIIGAVLAAWPVQGLKQIASGMGSDDGELWLMQGGEKGFVITATGSPSIAAGVANVPVDGTIWKVYFKARDASLGQTAWVLWGLLATGVIVVAVVVFVQQQALARSLRTDMAMLVTLGEAIESRETTPLSPRVSVASSRDAILLMTDLARQAMARPGAVAVENPAARTAAVPARSAPKTQFSEATGIEVEESQQRPPVKAPARAFRAYDIRGLAGQDLTGEIATGLGWAFAGMAHEKGIGTVYVAHDPRLSSPELYEALCSGLAEAGMRVVELGMAPAALLYFGMHQDTDSAAILVTGSHNPPEYNGFKLYLQAQPVQGEALRDLHARMAKGGFESRAGGSREQRDLKQDYLDAVAQEVSLTRPLHVVVDGGNGSAGELACEVLEMLGCEVTPLYCEPDGSFPHHHPDPSQVANLQPLQQEVLARTADLGVAFDGDGDRIGVVDNEGQLVLPEHILMLLAADILRRHPGSDVIYDVKSSRHLAGFVLAQGGRPIMWRSGHTRMKEKMHETGALVGGEFAGHIYIKERWYGSDDAIYVAARLLEVMADDPRPPHELVAELPRSPSTPEYQLPLAEGEAPQLMQAITAQVNFPDARIVDLDGLRVEFPQSWGLVRASNTVPSLTFRFEADNEAELEGIMQRFRELLAQAAPGKAVPF